MFTLDKLSLWKENQQIMVGNSGSLLYSQDQKPILCGVDLDGAKAQELRTLHGLGFAILDLDQHRISSMMKITMKLTLQT